MNIDFFVSFRFIPSCSLMLWCFSSQLMVNNRLGYIISIANLSPFARVAYYCSCTCYCCCCCCCAEKRDPTRFFLSLSRDLLIDSRLVKFDCVNSLEFYNMQIDDGSNRIAKKATGAILARQVALATSFC